MILNARDFGSSKFANQAVIEGYVNGCLTSASLIVNFEAFDNAINDILPDCPDLSLGIELNLTNGQSLSNLNLISDQNGILNHSFLYYFFNRKNQNLLEQIEQEFRLQIEKLQAYRKIDFIDSVGYIHSIPEIFEIVCKLAKEYGINYVKTFYEEFYIVPDFLKHLNLRYIKNLCNYIFQRYFANIDKKILTKYELQTNDFFVGLIYEKMMDSKSVLRGLNTIEEYGTAEVSVCPRKYDNQVKDLYTREFSLCLNKQLKQDIQELGFDIGSYKNISEV